MLENIPYRPCAMMLRMNPLTKFKDAETGRDKTDMLGEFIEDELTSFDMDYTPSIEFRTGLELPVKAENYLVITNKEDVPESRVELGYTANQVLLYLEYLRLSYAAIFKEGSIIIPFSSGKKGKHDETEGFIHKDTRNHKTILFFEKWGDHPDGFYENNSKLDVVMRYSANSLRFPAGTELSFIMDEELLHMMAVPQDKTLTPEVYINAGIKLYNFITSADMINLLGEWKMFREMDNPEKEKFNLPENCIHFGTWHGQLY